MMVVTLMVTTVPDGSRSTANGDARMASRSSDRVHVLDCPWANGDDPIGQNGRLVAGDGMLSSALQPPLTTFDADPRPWKEHEMLELIATVDEG